MSSWPKLTREAESGLSSCEAVLDVRGWPGVLQTTPMERASISARVGVVDVLLSAREGVVDVLLSAREGVGLLSGSMSQSSKSFESGDIASCAFAGIPCGEGQVGSHSSGAIEPEDSPGSVPVMGEVTGGVNNKVSSASNPGVVSVAVLVTPAEPRREEAVTI